MSRVSEYVQKLHELKARVKAIQEEARTIPWPPVLKHKVREEGAGDGLYEGMAWVWSITDEGMLEDPDGRQLTQEEALTLATWIQEVFA